MSRPRRRLFGPLFYSTLVAAALVVVYAAVLYGPDPPGVPPFAHRPRRRTESNASCPLPKDVPKSLV